MTSQKHIAIVGTGPASLMAAIQLAKQGCKISIFEQNSGPAAKFLIAGRSGLNISNAAPGLALPGFYDGPKRHFQDIFTAFGAHAWLNFIHQLGIKTFEGTSHRYFVEGLKSGPLLKAWIKKLQKHNATFHYNHVLTDFTSKNGQVELYFNDQAQSFDAACFGLGGGSWLKKQVTWPTVFYKKNVVVEELRAANAGFEVNWKPEFLTEAEGLPIKNITLASEQGTQPGDLMITSYGLEGSPIYSLDKPQTIYLDLKPDLSLETIIQRVSTAKENLAPNRLIKKYLNLCPAALALIYHHGKPDNLSQIKKFPIVLQKKRGLDQAISTSGGVAWSELNDELMLKKFPGIYVAGEMLNWTAPTGGFLIQGCVSQGYWVAQAIMRNF